MPNTLIIEGFDEWAAVPDELVSKADPLVEAAAEAAKDAVRSAYPRVTGRLQDGVIVETTSKGGGVIEYTVKSTAPHAAPFEWGSQQAGGQAARPTFLPITNRARQATTAAMVDLVEAVGLTVTGADS